MRRLATIAALLVLVAPALAEDRPVGGDHLSLRAPDLIHRRVRIVLKGSNIGPPFATPSGAGFSFSGGAAGGQCHYESRLDPARWRPLRGDGAANGYVYRGPRGDGIEFILIRPGLISVHARGSGWACDLGGAQRQPVTVELRFDDERYCAAFTAAILNQPGRYISLGQPAPTGCPKTDVTAATLNILHGVSGSGCFRTANCRLSERVDLLFDWIRARGCPDVVTMQEVSDAGAAFIQAHRSDACPFAYEMAYQRVTGVDDAVILSRYPIAATEVRPLFQNFRRVVYARIDHPVGPLGVFTTHLSSGSDGATTPCAAGCPSECAAAGATNTRECQAVQTAAFVAEKQQGYQIPALLTGDFNEPPDSFAYHQFTGRGWSDVYLDAGNPECDPVTGVGCTSGRADEQLSQLESPASNENERIDYVFLVPPEPTSICRAVLDSADDADGDGTATRLFADQPNPFAESCGPAPQSLCWPSDHVGVEVDFSCQ